MKKKTLKQKDRPNLSLTVRIDEEVREALERAAQAQDRSISWVIKHCIKTGLNVESQKAA